MYIHVISYSKFEKKSYNEDFSSPPPVKKLNAMCCSDSFLSAMQLKKVIILVDTGINGLWAFMWFVAFVYTADEWRKTSSDRRNSLGSKTINCGNSGVVFSFFCVFIWVRMLICIYVFPFTKYLYMYVFSLFENRPSLKHTE